MCVCVSRILKSTGRGWKWVNEIQPQSKRSLVLFSKCSQKQKCSSHLAAVSLPERWMSWKNLKFCSCQSVADSLFQHVSILSSPVFQLHRFFIWFTARDFSFASQNIGAFIQQIGRLRSELSQFLLWAWTLPDLWSQNLDGMVVVFRFKSPNRLLSHCCHGRADYSESKGHRFVSVKNHLVCRGFVERLTWRWRKKR